jgi:hypothetical protein
LGILVMFLSGFGSSTRRIMRTGKPARQQRHPKTSEPALGQGRLDASIAAAGYFSDSTY